MPVSPIPRTSFARTQILVAILALMGLTLAVLRRARPKGPPLRIATFNIEEYPNPKSPRQPQLAFETMRSLRASAIAVQEITDPEHFAAAAWTYLGGSWRFVYATRGPSYRVGVLFDEEVFALRSTRIYMDTIVRGRGLPTFEARLEPRQGGVVRLLVVHLQCCSDGVEHRRQQLERLAPIVDRARKSGDRVVLLGDFNATSDLDRERLANLAASTGMTWSSRALGCTAYWYPKDTCESSRLDHVLAWREGVRAKARGPCESEGCTPGRSCPVFYGEVSDHCPVTVDLP